MPENYDFQLCVQLAVEVCSELNERSNYSETNVHRHVRSSVDASEHLLNAFTPLEQNSREPRLCKRRFRCRSPRMRCPSASQARPGGSSILGVQLETSGVFFKQQNNLLPSTHFSIRFPQISNNPRSSSPTDKPMKISIPICHRKIS